jgi:hypothetical protein
METPMLQHYVKKDVLNIVTLSAMSSHLLKPGSRISVIEFDSMYCHCCGKRMSKQMLEDVSVETGISACIFTSSCLLSKNLQIKI